MTPLFSLKQRDYLRFRPQWGYFCPLNNPCVKAPNCPHCGQMCSPRCANDTLAFSCFAACGSFLRRKPPVGGFLLRLSLQQCSRTSAQRPVFGFPVGTRPAVPGKSDTAATRGSRGRTGSSPLCLLECFQALSDTFLLTFLVQLCKLLLIKLLDGELDGQERVQKAPILLSAVLRDDCRTLCLILKSSKTL